MIYCSHCKRNIGITCLGDSIAAGPWAFFGVVLKEQKEKELGEILSGEVLCVSCAGRRIENLEARAEENHEFFANQIAELEKDKDALRDGLNDAVNSYHEAQAEIDTLKQTIAILKEGAKRRSTEE